MPPLLKVSSNQARLITTLARPWKAQRKERLRTGTSNSTTLGKANPGHGLPPGTLCLPWDSAPVEHLACPHLLPHKRVGLGYWHADFEIRRDSSRWDWPWKSEKLWRPPQDSCTEPTNSAAEGTTARHHASSLPLPLTAVRYLQYISAERVKYCQVDMW